MFMTYKLVFKEHQSLGPWNLCTKLVSFIINNTKTFFLGRKRNFKREGVPSMLSLLPYI